MSTKFLSREDALKSSKWVVIDAAGKPVGRVASQVASILRGKTKPTFTPNQPAGDSVIVLNAKEVTLTGKKWKDKKYYDYSGYIGGLRERDANELRETYPHLVIKRAVQGMLPKGPLGEKLISMLRVYGGSEHPHKAQKVVNRDLS